MAQKLYTKSYAQKNAQILQMNNSRKYRYLAQVSYVVNFLQL